MREDIAKKSGNKFAVETLPHQDQGLATSPPTSGGSCTTSARQYRESFDVYGTKKSFEWTLVEHEPHVIHTAKKPEPEIPDEGDGARLRPPAAGADPPVHAAAEIHDAEHLSFIQGGGHGGSHPHLVNEFVTRPGRKPRPVAERRAISANWTCVGICAHQSAVKGGEIVRLPAFTLG